MNPHSDVYILCAFVYAIALLVVVLRTKTVLTPFHFCWALFIGELVLAVFPLMLDDSYGRTKISAPRLETVWILLGAGFLMGLSNALIRGERPYTLDQFKTETRVPRNLFILALVILCLVASVRSVARLGTFPLFVLARDGSGYSDVFEGFVTFLGWGAGRTLAVWLVMEVAMWPGRLLPFFMQNLVLCVGTSIGILLNVLDGQRNMLIMPVMLCIFALSRARKIGVRHLVVGGIAILLFFTAVGAFRMGETNKASARVKAFTHVPAVDNGIGNLVTYLEPNIDNLNNLISLNTPISYGKVILYEVLPDSILNHFMTAPESAVERLSNAGMFSYAGLTFRTIYADFYVDFGVVGTILLASIIYWFAVYSYNRAGGSPRHMLIYLILAQGIMNYPMINTMAGIPALVQLCLFGVLRFRNTSLDTLPPFT